MFELCERVENDSLIEEANILADVKNSISMDIRSLPFMFTGILPNLGIGPIGLDSEFITLKPGQYGSKFINKAAEVCLVSGFPYYKCFFHALIHHSPKKVYSYNTFKSGITERRLKDAPDFRFVRNQLLRILNFSNPLIIGCNISSDFKSLGISYNNVFDLHSFFYEKNKSQTGIQPISLRRIVYKFYKIDIQKKSHDCINDALYTVKIYVEIYLKWIKISKLYGLDFPPFNQEDFPYPSN